MIFPKDGEPGSTRFADGTTRPTYGQPHTNFETTEDGEELDLGSECVGWDLDFGARVSFGHNSAVGNELQANLSLSDYPAKFGGLQRKVTPEQLREFASKILNMVGWPDD